MFRLELRVEFLLQWIVQSYVIVESCSRLSIDHDHVQSEALIRRVLV
jgi:hypothetical protein